MSVKKVNRYKSEKANRADKIKREKLESTIAFALVVGISVIVIVWLVFIFTGRFTKNNDNYSTKEVTDATTVNIDPINDYVDSLEYFNMESETVETE